MKPISSNLLVACALTLIFLVTLRAGSAWADAIPNDGATDATSAIQAALDDAGKAGGEVYLPPGEYLIGGKLTVPTGVTLRGSWGGGHYGADWKKGSTLVITGGQGSDAGAAVTLEASSTIRGFSFLWPHELWNKIVPYPWAIFGAGINDTVEDITLINCYQGVKIGGPSLGDLHLIRNVYGCPLRYGIYLDRSRDIGRMENVHFNLNQWVRSGDPSATIGMDPSIKIGRLKPNEMAITTYQLANLEGFVFGQTDWEYVLDTFVFGAHIGYHFIKSPTGIPNGQFLGVGSDWGPICIQVDAIKPWGLMFTNGEFNNTRGADAAAIITSPGTEGSVQFSNCSFWRTFGHGALLQGNDTVKFTSCSFHDNTPGGTLVASAGKLIVSGCSFDDTGSAVVLKPGLSAAVIMGNLQTGGLQIDNGIGSHAQIIANETP